MGAVSPSPLELAGQYFGGLAHVHTALSNHPHHVESNLTVTKLAEVLTAEFKLQAPPLGYVLINEHASDPDKPRPLGRLSLRGRRLLRERRRPSWLGIPLWYGLEVSVLPNGRTDLTPRLADHCALVIASRHRLPSTTERDPRHIMELFHEMCNNASIDVIGHPLRYIDDIADIDWAGIFDAARRTHTAVELNFGNFPGPGESAGRSRVWEGWLKLLAESQAPIFIGTDIHNDVQLMSFIEQWKGLTGNVSNNKLASFVAALLNAGITPDRVVSSTPGRLKAWISIDKPQRGQLS